MPFGLLCTAIWRIFVRTLTLTSLTRCVSLVFAKHFLSFPPPPRPFEDERAFLPGNEPKAHVTCVSSQYAICEHNGTPRKYETTAVVYALLAATRFPGFFFRVRKIIQVIRLKKMTQTFYI